MMLKEFALWSESRSRNPSVQKMTPRIRAQMAPDTPVYNKSRNVFALNIAKKSRAGRVILTEGYMDTISLHQAGFDSAVASLGTSLTAEHAQLLARYFKDAVIAYDGDGAGAIPLLERAGLNVKVLRVKGAKDPDEFIKKYGPEAFARLLDKSENHIDYRLEQLRGRYDLSDDSQRVEFLREATGVIASLHSAVEREIYGGHAAQMAGISAEAMAQGVGSSSTRSAPPERARAARLHLSVRAHSPRWTQWPLMTHTTAVSAPRVRRVRAMCQACPRWKGLYSATIPAVAMG